MATPNNASSPNDQQDPTAGYRPKPKGPNFLGIVIASAIAILLILFAAVLFLRKDATKVDPHSPNSTPNSRLTVPVAPLSHTLNA